MALSFQIKWTMLVMLGAVVLGLQSSPVSAVVEEEESCRLIKMKREFNQCPYDMSYKPWPRDADCRRYNVTFAPKHTWKPRALAQFISGTSSGIGEMIEKLTGIYVGYIHAHVIRYSNNSNDGEANSYCLFRAPWNGRTIIQKSQNLDELQPEWLERKLLWSNDEISLKEFGNMLFNYQGILLIQDPWESLIKARLGTREAVRTCGCGAAPKKLKLKKERDFQGQDFQQFLIRGAKMWAENIKTWVTKSAHGPDVIIIKVEDIQADPEPNLRKVMKYLDIPVDEERLGCILKHPIIRHQHITPETRTLATKVVISNDLANQILLTGMEEINNLFVEKGIKEKLSYELPTL